MGASPKANVKRFEPEEGDVIVLLGGSTGRDGCGGATGSSKAHTEESIETCGAEVQKGNPPPSGKSSGCSATLPCPPSSSAAMTSAQAACAWPSASWLTA